MTLGMARCTGPGRGRSQCSHHLTTLQQQALSRNLRQQSMRKWASRKTHYRVRPVKIVTLLTDLFDAIGGIQTFNRSLVHALDSIAAERDLLVTNLVLTDKGVSSLAERYFDCNRTTYVPFRRHKPAFTLAALREVMDASVVVVGHVNFAPLVLGFQLLRPTLRTALAI